MCIRDRSKGARAYANHTYLLKMVEAAVIECPDIPIALHLDHGNSFELCKDCIDGGFTSVMFDGSAMPYEENVKIAKQVAEYAHAHGVVVEACLLYTSAYRGFCQRNGLNLPAVFLVDGRSKRCCFPVRKIIQYHK